MPYLETFLIAAIDAALAAQCAVTAAASLGLRQSAMGVFGLCIGYAAPGVANEVKPRLPQDAILYHDTYGNPVETKLRAAST